MENTAKTRGVHHVGLTVPDVEGTATFFTKVLGFREVRRDPSNSAIFVTDGIHLVTLWQVESNTPQPFDRKVNVGLHHIAFEVATTEELYALHTRLLRVEGVRIEFAPELLRGGPTMHMMCYEPGGIRIEFIVPA